MSVLSMETLMFIRELTDEAIEAARHVEKLTAERNEAWDEFHKLKYEYDKLKEKYGTSQAESN